MSNLISEVDQEALRNGKAPEDDPVSMDSESEGEQDAETGWDSQTDFHWDTATELEDGRSSQSSLEWEASSEQEAETGWDCTFASLPGDADYPTEPNKRDSGFASSAGDGSSVSDDPNATKYIQLPFRQKHYFLTYIQRILEATCLRYARGTFRDCLGNPEWKKLNLVFRSSEFQDDRLVWRDWLAEDEVELEYWMHMFRRVFGSQSAPVFDSVIELRNTAVHRGDHGDLGFDRLANAMTFPALLGDAIAESEITNAYRYVMEDSTLEAETKASVEAAMYTPQPCTSRHKLLHRVQTILEETCFRTAARRIPNILIENKWDGPERVEFQNWRDIFQNAGVHHDASADIVFPGTHHSELGWSLQNARNRIRNVVAHRTPLLDQDLAQRIHDAIYICILQGDWDHAIEIEILAETFLTGTPRLQVLRRLASVYRMGCVVSPYERERRIALAEFLARMEGGEAVEGGTVAVANIGVRGFWSLMVRLGLRKALPVSTGSSSMHEALMKVDLL